MVQLRKFFIAAALILTASMSIAAVSTAVSATSGECDDNAVVRCGVFSTTALRTSYKGDIKAVYNYVGLTDGMIQGTAATIKNGSVTKSGDVIVDGTVIATDAWSVGRQYKPGSTSFSAGNTTFYKRPTHVSFLSQELDAFVFVDRNGTFLGAVLKVCGNPVKATPKVMPKPAAACVSVTTRKISRTDHTFTATATRAHGATIAAYVFVVSGPGTSEAITVKTTGTTATTPVVRLQHPGTYTVYVTVKTSLGDKTGPSCRDKVIVEREPVVTPNNVTVCNPANGKTIVVDEDEAKNYKPIGDIACQPKVTPTTSTKGDEPVAVIASTGPADYLIGATGLGSLTAAGYYLRASRRHLLDTIRH